ncbi:hypothetical protein FSP39_018116 [Pinctada imbricata]|uniref:Uncharacterized protein n=1 Tax=Pinctada imbricata TaxID=66713 RepID=A0AA89C2L6_PINIB|nr:hypothetical protein FSP39_018116 [Pinctada imbricata]
MCRWGCALPNTTYMCKWCGTRYCKECLKGDFTGEMKEATKCRVCNQGRCQGQRVEYVPRPKQEEDDKNKKRSMSAPSRSKSAKSAKSTKSPKSAKSKSPGKSAKKSGKKKKK